MLFGQLEELGVTETAACRHIALRNHTMTLNVCCIRNLNELFGCLLPWRCFQTRLFDRASIAKFRGRYCLRELLRDLMVFFWK